MMTDSELIDALGGTAQVARRLRISTASVSEMRNSGMPAGRKLELAADIERVTGIRRWVMRPHDWHRIWPELTGMPGAPAVPEGVGAVSKASEREHAGAEPASASLHGN